MSVLRSLLFYIAFYLGTALFVIAALVSLPFSEPVFRKVVKGWAAYHRACARYLLGIRVTVEGGGPVSGPVLYAIRHESFFEAIDLPLMFDLPVVFAKQELFDIPGWGKVARDYGLVPVARDRGAQTLRRMLAAARKYSAQGRPLVIFPEGTRTAHGHTAPLQAGFAGLYKLLGLPVVPVAVDSGPLYHRRWKRPGKLTYRFAPAIEPGLDREEIEHRVLEAINALN